MAAHRADAGALAADIAAQQRKIGDLLHVVRATPVLRDAHAVDDDGALRLHIGAGGVFDVLARQAGLTLDVVPLRRSQVGGQRLEAGGVARDEVPVEDRPAARPRGRPRPLRPGPS